MKKYKTYVEILKENNMYDEYQRKLKEGYYNPLPSQWEPPNFEQISDNIDKNLYIRKRKLYLENKEKYREYHKKYYNKNLKKESLND